MLKNEIFGRLGKDPVSRFTPTGKEVVSFSVASDRSYTGGDGNQVKETTWIEMNAWGKTAELCKNLHKGDRVLIDFRLDAQPHTWQGQDGNVRASYRGTVERLTFIEPKRTGEPVFEGDDLSEDIPF